MTELTPAATMRNGLNVVPPGSLRNGVALTARVSASVQVTLSSVEDRGVTWGAPGVPGA